MSALMGKGKSTLTAELAYLTGLDEALVQKDLISFEWNGTAAAHFFYDIFCVRIRCQTADATSALDFPSETLLVERSTTAMSFLNRTGHIRYTES